LAICGAAGGAYIYRNNLSNLTLPGTSKSPPFIAVPLPAYLDRCVPVVSIHSHPQLAIFINDVRVTIPAQIGISAGCLRPLHTHDASGMIHIETDVNRTYTLKDFFLIWGNTMNDTKYTIFNHSQILNYTTDPVHTLTMKVNGVTNNDFENYSLPLNAAPCYPESSCHPVSIVITYAKVPSH
jgi:hypothetical protein